MRGDKAFYVTAGMFAQICMLNLRYTPVTPKQTQHQAKVTGSSRYGEGEVKLGAGWLYLPRQTAREPAKLTW